MEHLEKEVASLKQRNPTNVEPVVESSQSSSQSSSLSDAVNEALDIERRKMNLVITGIPPICDDVSDVDLWQAVFEDPVLIITGTVSINNASV